MLCIVILLYFDTATKSIAHPLSFLLKRFKGTNIYFHNFLLPEKVNVLIKNKDAISFVSGNFHQDF